MSLLNSFLSHIRNPVLSDRVETIGTDSEGKIDFVCFRTKSFIHFLEGNVFLLPSITGKHSFHSKVLQVSLSTAHRGKKGFL